jgi:hypothetical protein
MHLVESLGTGQGLVFGKRAINFSDMMIQYHAAEMLS